MAADGSRQVARWLTTTGAVVVTFGLCLWLFRFARFSWLPQAETDRWVVGAAFATVVASAVLAWIGWWAGREDRPNAQSGVNPGMRIKQRAKASGEARITQVGGYYYNHSDGRGRDG